MQIAETVGPTCRCFTEAQMITEVRLKKINPDKVGICFTVPELGWPVSVSVFVCACLKEHWNVYRLAEVGNNTSV